LLAGLELACWGVLVARTSGPGRLAPSVARYRRDGGPSQRNIPSSQQIPDRSIGLVEFAQGRLQAHINEQSAT